MWKFFPVLLFVFFASSPTVGQSATIGLDIDLQFTATKVTHACIPAINTDLPNPGPGNCGLYQDLELGKALSSYFSVSGIWDSETSRFDSGSTACMFGDNRCVLGVTTFLDFNDPLSFELDFGFGIFRSFRFDLTAGTGFYFWEDDDVPYYSRGTIELSDVRGSIGTSVVPLSASFPFLLVGVMLFSFLKRRA